MLHGVTDCLTPNISPQSTSEDIAHLCRSTGTTQLVHHESMKEPAEAAAALMGPDLTLVPMVRSAELGRTPLTETISCRSSLAPEEERETDCIIFHSSGSSGKPKVGTFAVLETSAPVVF